MKKGKTFDNVPVTGISSEGHGVARIEDKVVFIEDAIPGDEVSIITTRRKKRFDFASITDITEASASRSKPFCDHFDICGGCKWQHIKYDSQAEFKQEIINNAVDRIGKFEVEEKLPLIAATDHTEYRNKLEFTFSNKRWLRNSEIESEEKFNRNGLGFHKARYFDKVVHVEKCHLMDGSVNDIRNFVYQYSNDHDLEFYDVREKHGLLRNLIIRKTSLDEIMLVFSFGRNEKDSIKALLNAVQEQFSEIDSIQYVINEKRNDTIYDLKPHLHSGKEHIIESLAGLQFKIGPKSFFQTNTGQAEKLYKVISSFANVGLNDRILDLYCGVGSIGLSLANSCKEVVGVEIEASAIEDAKVNALLNKISNATFIVSKAEEALEKLENIDVLILDPPRAGLHPKVAQAIASSKIPRVVYVSCNPGTQARDLEVITENYTVKKSQGVDMFPQTTHVENVTLLELT